MNYYKIYKQLINKRISNPIDPTIVKCQKHHIKPKSCGGDDEAYNLIYLTMREHYIAHLLLTKCNISFSEKAAQIKACKMIIHFKDIFCDITKRQWDFKYNRALYKHLQRPDLFPTLTSYIRFKHS